MILGMTLARGGSKGVPKKNLRKLNGKPLIAHTIEAALCSTLLDKYIVASDSDEILRVAEKYGAETMKEPAELAQDNTPILEPLVYILNEAENKYGEIYDAVADLRATNPFKLSQDIDGAVHKLIQHSQDTDGVVGVSRLEDHHPSRIKRIVADRLVDFWPEPIGGLRQDLKPEAYIRNGSIYVFWTDLLRKGVYFIGPQNIRPWIMPPERGINIDTELDFLLAEQMMKGG